MFKRNLSWKIQFFVRLKSGVFSKTFGYYIVTVLRDKFCTELLTNILEKSQINTN